MGKLVSIKSAKVKKMVEKNRLNKAWSACIQRQVKLSADYRREMAKERMLQKKLEKELAELS